LFLSTYGLDGLRFTLENKDGDNDIYSYTIKLREEIPFFMDIHGMVPRLEHCFVTYEMILK